MSRIGKKAIHIPAGTDVSVSTTAIMVKGKGGTLERVVHPAISVKVAGAEVIVTPAEKTRLAQALWGTYAAHVRNMIAGVNTPFKKVLQVQGIGYKAELTGKDIKLSLGFSHPVIVPILQGLSVTIDKNVITVTSADKELVGQFAASIRALKVPEPYKGKGIRYEGEHVRQKEGKKATGA